MRREYDELGRLIQETAPDGDITRYRYDNPLDTGGIIFEVKHGGYQPVAADDYAHWAPAEGEPGTTELMAWYAQAQVGDSTFAV
ncbi:hypothetical protein NLP75_24140 [Escherichia coli]|nr:hypothetical protein [Escherichia coli]MDF6431355.1 hypothetical protein [Escherichia coli]MDF6623892.1 hypothetical protein [Escherichia coli]MDF6651710.1 hypothetical protein [Escherichia coli]MDF6762687.1 hypothetical protein [Escherichia coli]